MKTKMNNKVKALLMACCAVLLVFASVIGTLAYLTDTTDKVTNTFTVGKVDISLDEAKVNTKGEPLNANNDVVDLNSAARYTGTEAQNYQLIPGRKLTKDPTVTVAANSEECYVRVLVTVTTMDNLMAAFPYDAINNPDDKRYQEWYTDEGVFMLEKLVNVQSDWTFVKFDDATDTYEYRYKETVNTSSDDKKLTALFTTLSVPNTVNNTELAYLDKLEMKIVAHAIQSEGFANADKAWEEFPTT